MKRVSVFLFVAVLAAAESNVSDRFYSAIRADDTAAVRQLLADGAGVNVADNRGATPLHYAAAVGTPGMMRVLIEAGAAVNARTAFGATPLLWSAPSFAKIKLLVDKGADVNARSKFGNTPLTTAAAQAGNLDAVRYLLANGASLKDARNELGQTPLARAAHAGDTAMVQLLIEKGSDVNTRDRVGFTPLMFAAAQANVELAKLLLAKGADVNAQMEPTINMVKNGPIGVGRLSPLMFAVTSRNVELVRLLLDAGADVNAKDVRGMTPLMLAVASDHASPDVVRLLLAKKPDVRIKSKDAETALAWAAKFKNPAILDLVGSASDGAEPPRIAPVRVQRAGIGDPRKAAEKSMALIQNNTTSFLREGGCVSCHAQHITGMAVAIARERGIPYDRAAAEDVLRATRLEFASRADQFLERIDGPADTILTTALAALASQNVPPDRMTDAMLRSIAGQQHSDGCWTSLGIVRPPTADGSVSVTASSIHVLRHYAPPALKDETDERVSRAVAWLLRAEPSTTEDAVMQLLGAKWGGVDASTLDRLSRNLLVLQREDGGWAQTPQMQADAYGTATALYALHYGGGLPASDTAYRRGIAFLLRTQAADGSWYVASRAPKFQPYFESGFPYGHDQWISQWATGWATIALSLAVPENVAAK